MIIIATTIIMIDPIELIVTSSVGDTVTLGVRDGVVSEGSVEKNMNKLNRE